MLLKCVVGNELLKDDICYSSRPLYYTAIVINCVRLYRCSWCVHFLYYTRACLLMKCCPHVVDQHMGVAAAVGGLRKGHDNWILLEDDYLLILNIWLKQFLLGFFIISVTSHCRSGTRASEDPAEAGWVSSLTAARWDRPQQHRGHQGLQPQLLGWWWNDPGWL